MYHNTLHINHNNYQDCKIKQIFQFALTGLMGGCIDYRNMPDMFDKLSKLFVDEKIDAVIGNSMGGCFACHLSLAYSIPALCFNPALGYRSFEIALPEPKQNNNPIVFVIGRTSRSPLIL